jgi:hypothetical protein
MPSLLLRRGGHAPARPRLAIPLIALALLGAALAPAPARAALPAPPTDPMAAVNQVNALLPSVPEDERADLALIPALSEMAHPPGALVDQRAAALITTAHPNWSAVEAWAAALTQRAVLDALRPVTEEDARFAWAQPYGPAAPEEHRAAGIYTDLGDQNLLIAATHYHLGWLEELGSLVHVESTRLAEEGNVADALDWQVRWIRFSRIMANREFREEKSWAMRSINLAFERMRDLVYTYQADVEPDTLRDALDQVEPRDLELGRLRAPRVYQWAALQLIGQTMEPRVGPDPQRFGPTLARLAAGDRPLRLFGQAARWQRMADNHAGWYDTLDRLEALLNDIEFRWDLDPHDPTLEQRSDWERLDQARHALILEAVGDIQPLLEDRLRLRTEMAGTRLALAVAAFENRRGVLPPSLFAVRGAWIREIPGDPYYDDFETAQRLGEDTEPLRFFVPVRDFRTSDRVTPPPHRMQVSLAPGGTSGLAGASEARAGLDAFDRIAQQFRRNAGDIDFTTLEPEMRQVEEDLRLLAEQGVAADNVREKWPEITQRVYLDLSSDEDSIKEFEAAEEIFQRYADDPATLQEMQIVLLGTLLRGETVERSLETLRQGGALSESERRRLFIDVIDQYPDAMRAVVQVAEGSEGLGADTFEVVLTEEDFVVYSVGPNGADDGAAEVGDVGTDYLLWPPLLSLVRENALGG